jgi:hypothetical protein
MAVRTRKDAATAEKPDKPKAVNAATPPAEATDVAVATAAIVAEIAIRVPSGI